MFSCNFLYIENCIQSRNLEESLPANPNLIKRRDCMLKKKIIIHLLSLGVLCSGFVLCRYVFFDIHGMKQWPAILFGIGIIAVVISFILDGKTTPICIAFIVYRGGISEILRYSRRPYMVYEPKDL